MKNELYFTQSLTENEHYIVEDMIRGMCETEGWKCVYYRKFKKGHVPCYRECKITGGTPRQIKAALINMDLEVDNANEKVTWTNPNTGTTTVMEKWLRDDLTRK